MIRRFAAACLWTAAIGVVPLLFAARAEGKTPAAKSLKPTFSEAVAFDVWPRCMCSPSEQHFRKAPLAPSAEPIEIRPERGPVVRDRGYSGR